MPINREKGESERDFISRCISEEVTKGHETDQAAAICYQNLTISLVNERMEKQPRRLNKHVVRWQKENQ
jgi:hypothetical protein